LDMWHRRSGSTCAFTGAPVHAAMPVIAVPRWPSDPPPAPPAQVRQDRARRIVAGGAGDSAAGMRASAAMVEARHGAAVVGMSQQWASPEQLVERERAMKDVAADQPEGLLQVERAQRLAADDARLEARSVAVDRVNHQVGYFLAMITPGAAVRELGRDMLAEQARHMRALRGEAVVESGGDQNFDDRLAAPAMPARVRKGAV